MTDAVLSHPILTERLILRCWQEADRDPFAAMNADPRVMEYFPSTLDRAASDAVVDRLQAHDAAHGFTFWALEDRATGDFAGFTGLAHVGFAAHFVPVVEIGWRLPVAYWGRGIASEAARASLAFGFGRLALTEIVAFTPNRHLASRRVMERIGMKRDPADDFVHPRMPPDHPLQPFVLYRTSRAAWAETPAAEHDSLKEQP
ncbi:MULTISPECIES: GNAT family N-acetyltransferase [Rhodomicrobium]|uniref:GNAT family N-acetyltransferase n=1 Tax=Rhodomicrobium TaxID=1068 RepID=UPI000B4A84B7|nr:MULTISPECIES: GNAT family N-acetyltransferase [Rhodomicrobium]